MGGITATTSTGLLYGTNGFVTVDGTDLGATVGEFAIEWSAEQYYPDLAQALGPISGTGRVIKGEFKFKVSVTEWVYAVLQGLLATYGVSSDASSEKIGGADLGIISEVDNVILTGIHRNDNKPVRVTIPRAYVEVGNISISKSKETPIEITFHGVYTFANPAKLPGYIEIGK